MHALPQIPLPLLLVVVAIAAVVTVAVVYRVEDKLIDQRKKLAQLGKLLGNYGHTIASQFCQDAAIGDLPDAIKLVEDTLKTLSDPTAGPALMQADLLSQLSAQLAMPSAAPGVLQAVAAFAASPANAAVVKAAGLAVIAVA
jgi:hypothetical protein